MTSAPCTTWPGGSAPRADVPANRHPRAGAHRAPAHGLQTLEELAHGLAREFTAILPGGALSEASLEASRPLDRRALGRGNEMRSVYQDSARNDPATLAYARWLTEKGGQVRTSPLLPPPRLLIFDAKVAVVPIDPANSRLGALCTRAPGIVASLLTLFEQTWDSAVPLGADRPRPTDSKPTAGELELLKLLGDDGRSGRQAPRGVPADRPPPDVRSDGTP
ncbi:hypothetical protein ACIGFK_34425 [Streptomyces sp. NPDC085524]|uniref:hypothetical protein n=1 Tax=Streptomyces sp. NPDC085524 TaxID=3365728 RepID=UPI0037D3A261